jgi:hypothetical protein
VLKIFRGCDVVFGKITKTAIEVIVVLRRPDHDKLDERVLRFQGAEGEIAVSKLLTVEWE